MIEDDDIEDGRKQIYLKRDRGYPFQDKSRGLALYVEVIEEKKDGR